MNNLSSGRSSISLSHSASLKPHSAFHSHASGVVVVVAAWAVTFAPWGGEKEDTSWPVWRSIARIEVVFEPIKTCECSCGNVNGDRSILCDAISNQSSWKEEGRAKNAQLLHRDRQPLQPRIHLVPLLGGLVIRQENIQLAIMRIQDVHRFHTAITLDVVVVAPLRPHPHLDDARRVPAAYGRERIARPETCARAAFERVEGAVERLDEDHVQQIEVFPSVGARARARARAVGGWGAEVLRMGGAGGEVGMEECRCWIWACEWEYCGER